MLCIFHQISRNGPYIYFRRFYIRFRKSRGLQRTTLPILRPIGRLLFQTLFEKRVFSKQFETRFSKTIEKIPIGILSTKATTKPSTLLFFHFQNQILENLVSKPREKIGVGLFEYFLPDHFTTKNIHLVDNHPRMQTAPPTAKSMGFVYNTL